MFSQSRYREQCDSERFNSKPHLNSNKNMSPGCSTLDSVSLQCTSHIIAVMIWYLSNRWKISLWDFPNGKCGNLPFGFLYWTTVRWIQIWWNDKTQRKLVQSVTLTEKKWLETIIVMEKKKAMDLIVLWGSTASPHFLWCFACELI